DGGLQEELQHGRRAMPGRSRFRLHAMVDQVRAMGPHQRRQQQSRDRADQGGAPLTEQAVEEIHDRRRRPAQRPADAMDAVGAAQPAALHRRVQQPKSAGWKTQLPSPAITAIAAKATKEWASETRASATAMVVSPAMRMGRAPKRSTAKPATV